LNWKDVQFLE